MLKELSNKLSEETFLNECLFLSYQEITSKGFCMKRGLQCLRILLNRQSLSAQWMMTSIAFVLVPSMIIMAFYIADEYQQTRSENFYQLNTTVTVQQQAVEEWIRERNLDLYRLVNSPAARAGNLANLESLLQVFLNGQRDYQAFVYINKEGLTAIDTSGPTGLNLKDREYFKAAQEGRPFVTGTIIGRSSGKPIIIISAPVFDDNNEFQGAIFGSVGLQRLEVLTKQFTFRDTGELYLFDSNGKLLTRGREDENARGGASFQSVEELGQWEDYITAAGSVGRYRNAAGRDVYGSYKQIPTPGWILVGEIDEQQAYLSFYSKIVYVLGGFLIVLLFSIPAGCALARRVTRPLQELTQRAHIIRQGDYTAVSKDSQRQGPYEIRELEQAFAFMAQNLSKHIRELGEARDAALDASIAKSQFLATMSHEIRTPMNAIIGMADLLWETPLNDQQRNYVAIFRNAGDNLLNIINDILDYSKVEAGLLQIDNVQFNLIELVEKTCEIFALHAHNKGLELAARFDPATPAHIVGDPVRLRQILSNLLSNAVKFTESGEIVVQVSYQHGKAWMEVRDTGIGIPLKQQEMIFDSFTQVDASTTRKYGGTGLGLAISKRLAELMGGTLWLKSEPGSGSSFFIALPAEIAPGSALAVDFPVKLKGKKVLVVDDNTTNRLILREILQQCGAMVIDSTSGEEGLILLEQAVQEAAPFHLILSDYCMPQMDGYEFADRIRRNSKFDPTIFLLLTSSMRSDELERCKRLNIDCQLTKPVKRSELVAAIQQVLCKNEQCKIVEKTAVKEAGGRALSILLVEDSPDNRMLIEAYLRKTAHTVDMAENGAVAVEKFCKNQYDLVFMDMQMPVMDGYTATRSIRSWEKEQGRRATPIVALTAYALQEERAKSLGAGCTDHLTKPIKKAVLLQTIAGYAGGETH